MAGWLEPAAEVSGDTFDFSLDRDTLHVSLTDAVGHDVESAIISTILIGSLRNTRRRGGSLLEQAREAHKALITHAPAEGFVTGQLVRINLFTQKAKVVNAGHPPPFLLRGGQVKQMELEADMPFGALADGAWHEQEFPLEVGDRLVFLTDGMLERNAEGLDVPGILLSTRDMHPREAIQYFMHKVLEGAGGSLQDDATALCLDWLGGEQRDRVTHGGAEMTLGADSKE